MNPELLTVRTLWREINSAKLCETPKIKEGTHEIGHQALLVHAAVARCQQLPLSPSLKSVRPAAGRTLIPIS
jgi:hypothetical protein